MVTVTETKQNFKSFVEMLNASMGWDNKVTIVGDFVRANGKEVNVCGYNFAYKVKLTMDLLQETGEFE